MAQKNDMAESGYIFMLEVSLKDIIFKKVTNSSRWEIVFIDRFGDTTILLKRLLSNR